MQQERKAPADVGAAVRALVLVSSGKLSERPDLSLALEIFEAAGWDVDLRASRDLGKVMDEIAERGEVFDLLIAAGGDGTVRQVAGLAAKLEVPLGVIPLGTANDFARTLGLGFDVAAAARTILPRRTAAVDLSTINGNCFLNVASIGLSEAVAENLTKERKRRWGGLSYALALFDVLKARRQFSVEIDCDGTANSLRSIQVGVANGRYHGGGVEVSPSARIDDGALRVYAIEPQPLGKLLVMALSTKLGAHDLWEGVRWFEGKRIALKTKRAKRVSVDGDLITTTPLLAEVQHGALTVIVGHEFRSAARL